MKEQDFMGARCRKKKRSVNRKKVWVLDQGNVIERVIYHEKRGINDRG